ncbi:hypothetical protein BpHYR1_040875 [Brachionus plicatilis]|uniref:Uncharacterized protein n=1 Tax=Brachionus plicatilis TaxID=10195 RepID=A0A3M7PGD7_BRAPC|nr:hypothetical protein BpHYR1_040875 [Brachionus plicatilis]
MLMGPKELIRIFCDIFYLQYKYFITQRSFSKIFKNKTINQKTTRNSSLCIQDIILFSKTTNTVSLIKNKKKIKD